MPLAGGFLDSPAAIGTEQRYPLVVHLCERCSLIQITEPIDPSVLFDDYSFSATTVPGLVKHFRSYAEWLVQEFHPSLVVEFGANDGVLLGPLEELGVNAVGIDRSPNIAELARQRGHNVLTGAFTPELARSIRAEHGPADVVTGSNVFAHNSDPSMLLEAARQVLRPSGALCLEVMYAGDLLEQLQWDTLYHEHLTFYSLGTISNLLLRHGFQVVAAERLSMHGGSLRLVATADRSRAINDSVVALQRDEEETGIGSPERWRQFARASHRSIEVVGATMARLARNSSVWAYGAAGKATMWVNACSMDYLGAVVDASPLRAGKLMPGTHTSIVAPDEFRTGNPEYTLVTAWNYLDGIRAAEGWYSGIWATPLPQLTFHQ